MSDGVRKCRGKKKEKKKDIYELLLPEDKRERREVKRSNPDDLDYT